MEETMKKLSIPALVVLSLCFGLLFVTGSVEASPPQDIEITLSLDVTGPYTASGDFWISGAFQDSGTLSQTVRYTDEGSVQGTKVMVGQYGTITLRFNAELTESGEAFGHFVLLSGTGAYENIHGRGSTYAAFVFDNDILKIVGTYSGRAHIDP
jgi:hypothetical protein